MSHDNQSNHINHFTVSMINKHRSTLLSSYKRVLELKIIISPKATLVNGET